MKRKKKTILVIGAVVILLWMYFRTPIWFGELNSDRLERRDWKQHEKTAATLPDDTREYFEGPILEKYQWFLIWLQFEDDYYGLVNDTANNKGILLKLDLKNGKEEELFSVEGFACGMKMIGDHRLAFVSSKVDYRVDRGLLTFIDNPTFCRVLVDPMYWEYDFDEGELKRITMWNYWF